MNNSYLRVGGVVLCGGESRRMGRSKAWLRLDEGYLLQRVVRIVAAAVSPIVVASRRGLELPPLPGTVNIVFDADGLAGPLAGMISGFDSLAGRCDAAFVAACDHALLSPAFVVRMIELLADHDAVVPEYDGQLFPTVAVYRLRTRPLLAQLLAAGELRAKEFALRCDARRATPADFADVDPNLDALRNINTPEDYREALRSTAAGPGRPISCDDVMDSSGPEAGCTTE